MMVGDKDYPYDSLEASSKRLVDRLVEEPFFEKFNVLTFSAWQAVEEALGLREPFANLVRDDD